MGRDEFIFPSITDLRAGIGSAHRNDRIHTLALFSHYFGQFYLVVFMGKSMGDMADPPIPPPNSMYTFHHKERRVVLCRSLHKEWST